MTAIPAGRRRHLAFLPQLTVDSILLDWDTKHEGMCFHSRDPYPDGSLEGAVFADKPRKHAGLDPRKVCDDKPTFRDGMKTLRISLTERVGKRCGATPRPAVRGGEGTGVCNVSHAIAGKILHMNEG